MRRFNSSSCGVGFVCDTSGYKSRKVVSWGIEAVRNLTHRGAVGSDGKTGDGAGILIGMPHKFFRRQIEELGFTISDILNLAIGSFFLYGNVEEQIDEIVRRYGFKPLGWRTVPTNDDALGKAALLTKPRIRQLFIDTADVEAEKREVKLFLARKAVEKGFGSDVCISNISSKTVLYKGLLVAPQLERFYPDLLAEDLESAFCVFHQRFSTNTLPEWVMAQPFRMLAHNGEINTVQGNRNWMKALEPVVLSLFCDEHRDVVHPLVTDEESDSASLDRIMELLVLSGYSPEHAINLCIPPAWEHADLPPAERAFFEYVSLLMSPWDGPAAVVFTDGETVGAHLDRNGLRPLRYSITEGGIIILGSEAGMIDTGTNKILRRCRLDPGGTLSVNLATGRVKETGEIIRELAARKPYPEWIGGNLIRLKADDITEPSADPDLIRKQIAFGYSSEEIGTSIKSMAESAGEMTFSMGDDTPLPPLADKPQLLFRYFKQRFSQITNPSIDPIREKMVMSLAMCLGPRCNFLVETPVHARRLQIASPLLCENHLSLIEGNATLKTKRISFTYSARDLDLPGGLAGLRLAVTAAAENGADIIILSDRDTSRDRMAIPSLLAVSAAFTALLKKDIAHKVSLIVETAEARDVHHVACLIGFGASAVCPYLALLTIKDLCEKGEVPIPFEKAASNFKKAMEDGLLKVLARLGISTLSAYHGAQLFDINCLNRGFVHEYFGDLPVNAECDGLKEVEDSLRLRHSAGFVPSEPAYDYGGFLRYRKDGEYHAWGGPAVISLNRFIKNPDSSGYKAFAETADKRPVYLRHLLGFKTGEALPIEQVEPQEEILKRFVSGAMSVGALSPEAHETIAEGCNRLGMRSNSGEGGEDPVRYGTIKNSAIKQVASGRFGVTPAYLASASEIEIKVAQGAKPGEGGHLPASKVTGYIAGLRYCSPGMLLISPPPHHDIYSIEDLNQLIHDLKQANPEAKVCVKLVSEIGVGTVAAGVAKAYADIVQISGYEGGTGAAPVTSIKNVGNYWEIGLAEAQRVLIENGLRERIRIRIDGGMRTGRDVIIAALLGAEEFGFGTATMIAAGCVMARKCHLNTCPTGIATQDERLRSKYPGKAEGVMAYFRSLADEVRGMLARMGFRRMDEIVGRSDLLTIKEYQDYPGLKRIKLGPFMIPPAEGTILKSNGARNDNPAGSLNDSIVSDLLPYIERGQKISKEYGIRNIDRSIPVRINYHIARMYGDEGLPDGTIEIMFRGVAGQSFGAFNHKGLCITLIGEANDYVAKGIHGGRIVIRPDGIAEPHRHVIVGNTVLYGATGGEFFASGTAGERFCVRNSGATAVVEGAGQHLCEYMTRGEAVVLGQTGGNIGAGMTGGIIYISDSGGMLGGRINKAYVKLSELDDADIARLTTLIKAHHLYTGSPIAAEILADSKQLGSFKKVIPN